MPALLCRRSALFGVLMVLGACAPGPTVLSGFGDMRHPPDPRYPGGLPPLRPVPHTGVDFAGYWGQPVHAPADGVVLSASWYGRCGNTLNIHHPAFSAVTRYCHLAEIVVKEGPVRRGQLIARAGNTGDPEGHGLPRSMHLHWELTVAGRLVDPLAYTVGCHEPGRTYPTDRLVLTYPVGC